MPEVIDLTESLLNNPNIIYVVKDHLHYIQFKNLKKYEDIAIHCFTTRKGGVSTNEFESLNLGLNTNDSRENVLENFRRISEALGIDFNNMVFSNQVHECRIKPVDENDRGKGIVRKSDITGYDGLVTDKKGVALVTFYADCVPLFFLDPVKKVIALSHSGWRGTVKEIAKETIKTMNEKYGSMPHDVEVAIGPSIGSCCFEVGSDVYIEFADRLSWSKDFCTKTSTGKWHINLQQIIKSTLINSGVKEENICVSEICTRCNTDTFFSHRGQNGKRGSLAAIMQLV